MDIIVLFQRFFHVKLRRLLLIISIVVAVIVLIQCFELPFGRSWSSSPADKGSVVLMVGNASFISDSNSTKILVAVVNEEETDMNYNSLDANQEFMFKKDVNDGKSLVLGYVTNTDNSSTQINDIESEHGHLENVEKTEESYEIDDDRKATTGLHSRGIRNKPGIASVVSQGISTREVEENLDANSSTSVSFFTANLSLADSVKQTIETEVVDKELSQTVSSILNNNFTKVDVSFLKRRRMQPTSISQMNSLLIQSHVSSTSARPLWSSARDHELLSAKLEIQKAPVLRNTPGLYASVFRNVSTFRRSYELMEHVLKVYIYKEGDKPIFHQARMRGIYASEGWFMKLMEGNKKFVVRNPKKAHLFYLPFSAKMLRSALFEQKLKGAKDLQNHLNSYVELIAGKYRFWNRTGGADHFLVACHDWGPKLTRQHMKNCIRSLCNSNVATGFKIGVDTTLPVTYIRSMGTPLIELGGKPPSERSILAFFAGSMHGYLRPILLQLWENKEADMKVFGPMPRDIEGKRIYREYMKSSKYCICARGYEVHTPRVVESIFYECVPVIISDNYVPPFFEVLNWEAFAVFVQEKDIPDLRNILLSIPEERYLAMQSGVKEVQKHFLWHKTPVKYDLFHMILHSIWYNRVFGVRTK